MRGLSLILMMAGAAAPLRAQQPDTAVATLQVSLEEAVRRALDVQPAMVQARGDSRNAGAAMTASNASFLPSITASGSSARAGGTRFDTQRNQIIQLGATTAFSGSIGASLDLFTGFRRLSDRRVSAATEHAADAGLVNQRFQVTLQTKQAFYNALATEEKVAVADAQRRRAQQQLETAVQKLHAGSATRSDSLRSVVDLGNAQLALLQAQADLATAEANLGRQIGVTQPVRAVPDSLLPPLPDTTALRATVQESAPQVLQAEAQARAAGAQVALARAAYWPSLNASISNSYSGQEAPWVSTSTYGRGWNVRFGVSWTLFNNFQREKAMINASVARDVAQAKADDSRRAVAAQYTQQLAALQTAFAKLDITASNVAAATEDLRVQQERYRVGASTILDILTSQANLTQALTDQVQARFDYLVARAQLEALVGRSL
jgi:outer membrane protein